MKTLSLINKKTGMSCVFIVLLALLNSILASVWPVRLGNLYTDVSSGKIADISHGLIPLAIFGSIYIFSEILGIIRRVSIDCVIASQEKDTRRYIIEKILKMPLSNYSGSLSGEKTAKINQGVSGMSQLIKIVCNDIVSTVLIALCTLAQVLMNAPHLILLIMISYLFATIAISIFQIHSQNGIREKIIEYKTSLDGSICESINNIEFIRNMNAERFETDRLSPSIRNICLTEQRHHIYMGSFDSVKQFFKVLFQLLIIAVSIMEISKGNMSSGGVITVCLLFQNLIKPLDDVYRFMDETASAAIKVKSLTDISSSKCDEIFEYSSENRSYDDNIVSLNDVTVISPDGDEIASFESIEIPCDGRVIALVGPNGSGKTSLVRCVTGYYHHSTGDVSLFGRNLESYSRDELIDKVFSSPQKSFFIAGTIRDNLTYGLKRKVEEKELIDALLNVHLAGFDHNDTVIKKNPLDALDYVIGENAPELSGGMKQRLALARAFIHRPRLFIFDEATANIDSKAAKVVLSNVEAFAKRIGATVLYISHDPEVIGRADKIIQLNNRLRSDLKRESVA